MRTKTIRRALPWGLAVLTPQKWRRWRVGRYASYIARNAVHQEPASEHYYDKIYSEAAAYARDIETRIACLIGETEAERVILAESRRARSPFRLTVGVCLFANWRYDLLGFSLAGVRNLAGGLILVALGAWVGRKRARRTIGGFLSRRGSSLCGVLDLLTPAGRRYVRHRGLRFPARTLLEHCGQEIAGGLGESEETIETAMTLAEEFDGTISELIETARCLN